MSSIIELKDELNDITTLKFIAQAFTEAAAAKLQKIRSEFEKNRSFYEEISHVYHLVRVSGKFLKISPVKDIEQKKVLSVAVTSNQRFYGNINMQIMRVILDEVEANKSDLYILGNTGLDFLRISGKTVNYQSLSFAKDFPTGAELQSFLEKTYAYDSVFVYFPKFVTLITQTVGKTDISQMANVNDPTPEEEIHILFEPEYSKILEFFQHQVRLLLFTRMMLEADLARTAARLLTMSAAEERSDDMIKEKHSQMRKAINSQVNRQLLETFAGMMVWKGK